MLNITALFLVITALLAYLNHRFIGMPTAIGVMSAALVLSLSLIGLNAIGLAEGLLQYERSLLRSVDFSHALHQDLRKIDRAEQGPFVLQQALRHPQGVQPN